MADLELSSLKGSEVVRNFRQPFQNGDHNRESPQKQAFAHGESLDSIYLLVQDINHADEWCSMSQFDYPYDEKSDFAEYDGSYLDCFDEHLLTPARTPRVFPRVTGGWRDLTPPTEDDHPDVIYDAQQGFSRYGYYNQVQVIPNLPISREYSTTFHANSLGSQLNIPGWLHEFQYENDFALRDYLYFGALNGFYIVDPDVHIAPYCRDNYSSVMKGEAHAFIDNLMKAEISQRKYVITNKQPTCIHSIGAVPKKAGGMAPHYRL